MHSILVLRYALLQKTRLSSHMLLSSRAISDNLDIANQANLNAKPVIDQPLENHDKSPVTQVDNFYFFYCPHCLGGVQVQTDQVACRIFRHGAYRLPDNPPIGPHTSKEECDRLVETNAITGCAKPFLFVFDPTGGTKHYVEKCGYI